jgi:hypothetical protein
LQQLELVGTDMITPILIAQGWQQERRPTSAVIFYVEYLTIHSSLQQFRNYDLPGTPLPCAVCPTVIDRCLLTVLLRRMPFVFYYNHSSNDQRQTEQVSKESMQLFKRLDIH